MSFTTVPAFELMRDVRLEVDNLYRTALYAYLRIGPEPNEEEQEAAPLISIHTKACARYGIEPVKPPSDLPITDRELVDRYIKGTPFEERFYHPVELPWRLQERMTHTHIIGRTDAGKTTLMERMIHEDLLDPAQPSLVVLTPHGDLIRSLRTLAPPLSDRMIVIDPADVKYPPAINPFSSKREISANGVIRTFDYILASLGLQLTPKQRALWKPVIRMLLTFPAARGKTATIADIRDFMLRPEKFEDVIRRLNDPSFFLDSVLPARSAFTSTREEIGYRLSDILDDPAIRNILTAEETKVDFYDELQNRKSVILIDTAKHALSDGSSLFGGMMLAAVYQAMLARDAITDERKRHPTFLYIDEAANYLSEDLSEMLTELRKFRCGLVLAHHELAQAEKRSTALARSLVSQPGIRFCHPSADDAPQLAKEMNTTPDQLRNLPKHHFALYIRGQTPHPIPTKITPLSLPRMSIAQQEVFKWKNRERVSVPKQKPAPTPLRLVAEEQQPYEPPAKGGDNEWE